MMWRRERVKAEPICVYCGAQPPRMPMAALGPTQEPGEPACGQCAHHPSDEAIRIGYQMTTYGRWNVSCYVCPRGHDIFDWTDAVDVVCEQCRCDGKRGIEMVK